MQNMSDEFIPKKNLFRVVIINQDIREYKRYGANIDTNNNENNLKYALGLAGIEDSGLLNDYIYSDVNESRQNLYIKLILAINNLQTTAIAIDNTSQPMLAFNFQGNLIALND